MGETNYDRYSGELLMRRIVTLMVIAVPFALAMSGPAEAQAAPALLWQAPGPGSEQRGEAAGQMSSPAGMATNPTNGDVYVADLGNARIDEFTAWGEFVRAFGWGVNASSPEEKPQVCTVASGCRAGIEGAGAGQFSSPTGITIDAGGDVFVMDRNNHRVQKFDSEGNFLLMFGGEVNKTKVEIPLASEAERNRCPVDLGDECQAGTPGTGNGQFATPSFFQSTNYVAAAPDGSIYVGDVDRIQVFNANGVYQGDIHLPKEGEVPGGVAEGAGVSAGSLAVDGEGNLYFAFEPAEGNVDVYPNIYKHTALGWSLFAKTSGLTPAIPTPNESGMIITGLAADAAGNVYASVAPTSNFARVVEFDPAGNPLIPDEAELEAQVQEPPVAPFPFAQVGKDSIHGLATSSACGIAGADLLTSYTSFDPSFIRAYGPAPDPAICPPPPVAPTVDDTYAISVDTNAATVQAKINPRFWRDTSYYVEYGTGKCSERGCDARQPSGAGSELGSDAGISVTTAGVFLNGLTSGITYHYRFVAESGGGGPTVGPEETFTTAEPALPLKADCPNQVFRVGRGAALPECRAYELVSPADKEGGEITSLVPPLAGKHASIYQSSTSGDRFTYSAYRPFGQAASSPYTSQYLAVRNPESGWSSVGISPPRGRPLLSATYSDDAEYKAFSPDLCNGWLRFEFEPDPPLDPEEVDGYMNLYRHDLCGGEGYEALTTVNPPHEPFVADYLPEIQGFSADGRCTVFRANDSLTPEAPSLGALKSMLYEDCGGKLRLVATLPGGTPAITSSTAGVGNIEELNYGFQYRTPNVLSAVSEDGSHVYWTTPGTGVGTIYLRINADQPQSAMSGGSCTEPEMACTLPVSEKASNGGARFWAASSDGTHAIFSTEGGKLYEYDASNPFKPKATPIAEGVLGVMGASVDVSRVYFASTKALAAGATAGKPNLYYLQQGEPPRFIGTLATDDIGLAPSLLKAIAITPEPYKRTSRVSPDGLHATFMSAAPLTGFDNTDQSNGKADREVFLYDANAEGGEGRLVCVSCDPSGTRPIGRNIADSVNQIWVAAQIPPWDMDMHGSSAISEDGSRVFFDSYGPLVQRDTNGKEDVYEWHSADSKAACEEMGAERYAPESHGCISLISSGDSSKDSEFIEASPSGNDVFFTTDSSLVAGDAGLIDVYDARVDGGFPPPSGRPEGCEGEACQKAPPPPNDPTPASASFKGQGNVEPTSSRRCPKGRQQVTKRGKARCVKQRRSHHRHNHRHANAERRSHR